MRAELLKEGCQFFCVCFYPFSLRLLFTATLKAKFDCFFSLIFRTSGKVTTRNTLANNLYGFRCEPTQQGFLAYFPRCTFFKEWITHINELQIHVVWVFHYPPSIFIRAATLRVYPFNVLNWQLQYAPHSTHKTSNEQEFIWFIPRCYLSILKQKMPPVILLQAYRKHRWWWL